MTYDFGIAPANYVLILGERQALGRAVATAFDAAGFDVLTTATEAGTAVYAIVLVSPVVVYDYGGTRPRRYAVGVDTLAGDDPRGSEQWVGARQRLGTRTSRDFVEAVAESGTRVALLSASLLLDPHPRGELEGQFAPEEIPLLLHEQLTILAEPLPLALPSLWCVDALPSASRDGWGLGCTTALHTPPPPHTRADQLAETARSLIARLAELRRIGPELQLGEAPF